MENFEHKAKQQLEQYQSPLDTDKMWAHIDAQLRPDSRRRLAWLWLTIGMAGAVATWIIANQYNTKLPQTPIDASAGTSTHAPISLPGSAFDTNTHSATDFNTLPAANSAKTPENYSKTPKSTENTQNNSHKSVLAHPMERDQRLLPAGNIDPNEALPTPSHLEQSALSETIYKPAIEPVLQGKLPASIGQVTNKATFTTAAAAAQPNTNCYDWRPKPQLYGGVYAGASYPFKSLTASKKEDEPYAELRKNTESVLESVQGGVMLGVMTPKKIFVEAGVEYNRINERFRTSTTTIDTIARYEVIGWVINAQGDTTFVRDSVLVTETTTTGATIYNNFQFYNIPIALGYEFGNAKNRLRPYIKGGIAINIAMPYKSGFLSPTGDIKIFESSGNTTNTPYRTRINGLPFVAVGARMTLSERLDAFGELNYRHHLTHVTQNSYLLQQRYSLLGLNLGLSMRF